MNNLEKTLNNQDALLSCFQIIAGHYERPQAKTVLLSGLDYDPEEGLSQSTLLRAAERIGLQCSIKKIGFHSLFPVHIPAIIFINQNQPLIIFDKISDDTILTQQAFTDERTAVSLAELEAMYQGTAVLFEPVFVAPETHISSSDHVRVSKQHWFWGTLGLFWKNYLYVVLAAATINIIALASPLFVLNVYDRVLPNKAFSTLWMLALGLALAFLFDFLIKMARAHLIDHVGRHVDIKLSSLLFEKILNTDLKHRSESSGAYVSKVQQYEFIREFFTSNTIALFTDTIFIFLFLWVVYYLSDWVVLFPLSAFVITVIIGLFIQYLIGKKLSKAQNEASLRQGILVETISSIETLKSLRAEGYFLKKWDNYAKFASGTTAEIKSLSATALNITQFLQQSVTLGIIVGGTYQFAEGNMSMGAIIATMMLSSRTIAPLSQIAVTLSRARQARLSLSILNEIMVQPDEREFTHNFVNRKISDGEITFQSVSFQYPQVDRLVLKDLSFKIAPGEKVGIIGHSGSGKTTIGRLITRLYPASEGEILIDGIDVRQYHIHELRKAIGFGQQDADLFLGSVKENLRIADPTADDDKILAVAKLSGVERFVAQHKLGFDMPVGERGNNLSGGQKQAISFARVIITNPKIIILDEPSSSMDRQAVSELISNVKTIIRPEQTLIISTHQHQLLELVDRLIVLGNGRIVADGPKLKVLAALQKQARINKSNS